MSSDGLLVERSVEMKAVSTVEMTAESMVESLAELKADL